MTEQTSSQQTYKSFAIIGGGIAGLTAAIAFKRIGIETMVYEAAPEIRSVGAGITLAYNALKAFKHLEMYDTIKSAGQLFDQMTIYDEYGKMINRMDIRQIEGAANVAIHRADLHRTLLRELDDEKIITGKRSSDIRKTKHGYQIKFEDGTLLNVKNLIVAEGIHSVIRSKIIPDAEVRYAGYTCWRGIAENSLDLQETSETWGRNGRFGIVPIRDNKVYWFACKKAPANSEQMKAYDTQDLCQNFKNYHEPVGELIRSTPSDQIFWNDIIDLKPIDRYAFGNLVLIGDAAHATTPNMGQGACQAIEDAVVLADCLTQNSSVKEAFTCFEQRRIGRTHSIVNQSWSMGKVAQCENPILGRIRNFIFRMLPQRFYKRQLQKIFTLD